jgi:hypothetical protein
MCGTVEKAYREDKFSLQKEMFAISKTAENKKNNATDSADVPSGATGFLKPKKTLFGKKKTFWTKLRSVVKTGVVKNIDWRKSRKTKANAMSPERKAAAILLKKVQSVRMLNTERKITRFSKHSTRRSSFLSTNASSKQADKARKIAEKGKWEQDKARMQRRRSVATGEIMASMQGLRPQSAPRRAIVSIGSDGASSEEEKDVSSEDEDEDVDADEGEGEGEGKEKKAEVKIEVEKKRKRTRMQQPKGSMLTEATKDGVADKAHTSVANQRLKLEERIQRACAKHHGLNIYNQSGPPLSSLHVPKAKFWGADQMNTRVDGRNKCRLPVFITQGNSVVWIAGAAERRNYKYGFRPFFSETARYSDLYSKNHDILDLSCQSARRTVFVTQERGEGGKSKVWFAQGEAQSMKGGSLAKAEITMITHLPEDIEHVACTKGRCYVLSNRGDIYSFAPKPQDDPRYVWEIPPTTTKQSSDAETTESEIIDNNGKTNVSFFIRKMPRLCQKRIVSISAGTNHVVCINHGGMAWSWGEGVALGLGEHVVDVPHPSLLMDLYKVRQLRVIQISAGSHHTLALAIQQSRNKKNNRSTQVCLSWGAWDARLGTVRRPTTTTLDTCWRPSVMNRIKRSKKNATIFSSMHAGGNHSVALEKKGGCIWCFGNNNVGQLGVGHLKALWTPTKLRHPTNVIDVGVGERHTVVVTSLGDVWSWGDNGEGELGLTGGLACRVIPRIVMGGLHGTKAQRVCVGGRVTVLITERLHHDTHGKWVSINRGSRERENVCNEKNKRESAKPKKKKKKGWGRIRTFEKRRVAEEKEKEKEIVEQQTMLKEQHAIREQRGKLGVGAADTDSSEDSDDDGSDILQEIRIARKVKAEADTVQFLETTLFMKPSQLMTRRKFQVWMQRAPEWMMLCAEWNDNIQLRNVVVSSDRTLWLRGRIAKGGEDRQIRLSNNLKRFQVRDAFFQQRKHVKNVIKAQARARGMFIRLEMLTKRKELAHRKRVQERQKEEIQENKERRIKSRRRKSIISLPPRTLSIAAVVSAAARAKKQFKVVENIL